MTKKTGLGRGLDALFSDEQTSAFFMCAIDKIRPNRYQPRQEIDHNDSEFQELVASVKEKGVLQPLIVTPFKDEYELIAGERRLEAARQAGLKEVPVIVRENISDVERLEMALIENLQRQDLTPLEEAEAYYRLITEFGLTQEQVAQRVGKDRATVANVLRLRQLPSMIKEDLAQGRLTMGHARALLGLPLEQQLALREEIISKKLSVRETERRVQGTKKRPQKQNPNIYYQDLVEKLTEALGTKVKITPGKRGGKIEICFYSEDELSRLVEAILGNTVEA
ncbi:MAG: ParB/RepB/Spo0J family partition protein [Candidatus Desulfofervidaceae bacterium]|nr:ParB/RepB/Spo0J family partition protein [Candidatus Desulfofervidaceae bacterium]